MTWLELEYDTNIVRPTNSIPLPLNLHVGAQGIRGGGRGFDSPGKTQVIGQGDGFSKRYETLVVR